MASRAAERLDLPLAAIAGTAAAYIAFFHLNDWLFSHVKVNDNISWIFLPAAVRMVAVLLFGWAGAVGLFLGSLGVMPDMVVQAPLHSTFLAVLSSFPQLGAALLVRSLLRVPASLVGMNGRHLLCFGVAGGLANSGAHTLYFVARQSSLAPLAGFIPMFVGDAVGTFLMLYAGVLLLRVVRLPGQAG